MVYLDPVAVVAEGVPWWVILLAVLAGLLVLALLVLLMWKVRLGEGGAGGGWVSRSGRWPFLLWFSSTHSHLLSKSASNTYPPVPGILSGPGCFRDKSDADLYIYISI